MKVLIVAKTRMRSGACVGAITFEGQSARLIAPDQETSEHFNLEYAIGEVWEIDAAPPSAIKPPHVENLVAREKRRLRVVSPHRMIGFIEKTMPPATGSLDALFDGLLQWQTGGPLYVAEATGVPSRSALFWRPDRDLLRDEEGKRIRYRYPTADGGRTMTFVGFQEPLEVIPAGSLLRVSLADWWQPADRPDAEPRCYVQLSGWFDADARARKMPQGAALMPVSGPATTQAAPLSLIDGQLAAARSLLKSVFGYDEFLPLQESIIANALARRDSLAIMPTGGGKSMCYQLPALIFDGLTVVVSPLIALMQDQVDALLAQGVPAAYLNSTVAYHAYVETANAVRSGEIKLLYMAPETLLRSEILLMLDRSNVACLTIDEAHCISSWGHDFRPEYRQLLSVRQRYGQAVCLALTATATKRVQDDIKQVLGFGESNTFVASFNRPNLFLAVQPRIDRLAQILSFLGAHREQAGIIYCRTRRDTELLADQLTQLGFPALPYHAGMADAARRENQRRFNRDETQIIVATIAFGMGINKSNVRFILHADLPENLENYYQQIGRAGRDGLPADCLLLWGKADLRLIRRFIKEAPPAEQPGKEARMQAMLRYAEATGCRRAPLLAYFGERFAGSCDQCDNCAPSQSPQSSTEIAPAKASSKAPARVADEGAAALFEELRKLRLSLARDSGLPPFVIFSDRTLQEMAQKQPRTETELLAVSGVGNAKMARYGEQFLEAIRAYCDATGSAATPQIAPARVVDKQRSSARCAEIGSLFAAGQSVEELQRLYGVKQATILDHLVEYHAQGQPVDGARLLPYTRASETQRADALALFAELGASILRPVFDALGGEVSFEDLRLLRIYYLSS